MGSGLDNQRLIAFASGLGGRPLSFHGAERLLVDVCLREPAASLINIPCDRAEVLRERLADPIAEHCFVVRAVGPTAEEAIVRRQRSSLELLQRDIICLGHRKQRLEVLLGADVVISLRDLSRLCAIPSVPTLKISNWVAFVVPSPFVCRGHTRRHLHSTVLSQVAARFNPTGLNTRASSSVGLGGGLKLKRCGYDVP